MRKRSYVMAVDAIIEAYEGIQSRLKRVNDIAREFYGHLDDLLTYRNRNVWVESFQFNRYGFAARKIASYILTGQAEIKLTSVDLKIAIECIEQDEWFRVKFRKKIKTQ